jgi:protein SCO1
MGTATHECLFMRPLMPSRISQRLLWGVLSLSLLLIAGFAIAKWTHENTRHLEDFGALPNFSLVDEHGSSASLQNFKGHIWVADLIFTHCSSICPMLTTKMIALQSALVGKQDVRFASISVDPLHDTPDTLLAYANAHHANTERWTFLTGTTSSIYTLIKTGFHLPLDSVGGEERVPIIHSPRFTLLDGNGHIRGYYNGLEAGTQKQLLADIDALENEANP